MIYPVVKFGNPVLEQPAETIREFDTPELHKLIEDMFETMYAARGVGLAAPQIAISRRIAVLDISGGEGPPQKLVLINPEIISNEGKQVTEEGCLSVPGYREPVRRGAKVTVRAQNVKGEPFEITGEELLARALQHELDHLNGRLYLSRLSPLKRDLIRRRIRRLQKAGEWD
ncbi:MAG: peptide deformylase [Acidobacteriales bacterium]|nr:MAG: peptide deformylase [Terriglobales bacterium]